jgi:hypothetical protein
MGLKYEVFMIKGTADDLYKNLLKTFPDHFTDTSELSKREREWYQRPLKKTTSIDEFKDALDPKDPELEAWMKDGGQTGYHIWWMNHPNTEGFVVGGYTTHFMHEAEYMSIIAGIFIKAGIDEFVKISFHHGSNDGDILKLHLQKDPIEGDNYDHKKGEGEHWDKYAKRVDKLCKFPVVAWHKYISDYMIHFVPWTYSLTIKEKV